MSYKIEYLACVKPLPTEVVGKWQALWDKFILACAELGVCPRCHNPFTGYYNNNEKCQCGFPEDWSDE